MDKKSKEFLFEYLNNASPTGFESSGQQIWLDYMNVPDSSEYRQQWIVVDNKRIRVVAITSIKPKKILANCKFCLRTFSIFFVSVNIYC